MTLFNLFTSKRDTSVQDELINLQRARIQSLENENKGLHEYLNQYQQQLFKGE